MKVKHPSFLLSGVPGASCLLGGAARTWNKIMSLQDPASKAPQAPSNSMTITNRKVKVNEETEAVIPTAQ